MSVDAEFIHHFGLNAGFLQRRQIFCGRKIGAIEHGTLWYLLFFYRFGGQKVDQTIGFRGDHSQYCLESLSFQSRSDKASQVP